MSIVLVGEGDMLERQCEAEDVSALAFLVTG